MVALLLEAGADPDAANNAGATALQTVSENSFWGRILLEAGDSGAVSTPDTTPRRVVFVDPNAAIVALLLEAGADPNARDERGETPLPWASELGDARIIALLTQAGVNVNARDDRGATPLHGATREGDTAIIRVLVEAGANPDARNDRGETPLHIASDRGSDSTVIAVLVVAGADVGARDDDGRTPLHAAEQHQDPAAINALLAGRCRPGGSGPLGRHTAPCCGVPGKIRGNRRGDTPGGSRGCEFPGRQRRNPVACAAFVRISPRPRRPFRVAGRRRGCERARWKWRHPVAREPPPGLCGGTRSRGRGCERKRSRRPNPPARGSWRRLSSPRCGTGGRGGLSGRTGPRRQDPVAQSSRMGRRSRHHCDPGRGRGGCTRAGRGGTDGTARGGGERRRRRGRCACGRGIRCGRARRQRQHASACRAGIRWLVETEPRRGAEVAGTRSGPPGAQRPRRGGRSHPLRELEQPGVPDNGHPRTADRVRGRRPRHQRPGRPRRDPPAPCRCELGFGRCSLPRQSGRGRPRAQPPG